MDVTRSERLVFPLTTRPVLGYEEYTDLPRDTSLQVYSLEEIGAEKVVALQDRARNEPRDLYGRHRLRGRGEVGVSPRQQESRTACAGRQGDPVQLWQTRLAAQMADLPPFDEVFRVVCRAFRHVGLG